MKKGKCRYGCKGQTGGRIGTPEERQLANFTAQRIASKHGHIDPTNVTIGKFIPEFVDMSGNPYIGSQMRQLPTTVPSDIKLSDIQTDQGIYWYVDPQTGDTVDVDPTVVNKFKNPKSPISPSVLNRSSGFATRRRGGIYQTGGVNRSILPTYTPEESSADFDKRYPDMYEWWKPQVNQVQKGLQTGIIEPPADWQGTPTEWYDYMNSSPEQENKEKKNWMFPLGIGLMGARGVLSEISGRIERGRQDSYDMRQQRLLGSMDPVNINDYQPSPYNLYAKYGGKLVDYQKDFNNNVHMNMGTKYYKHGGNMKMSPYHNLSEEEYNAILQQGVPEGFHLMEDGTLMADNEMKKMYRGGGKWIQKAIKHPGRCTPGSPNYDCPEGSPQWRLAQRFKSGDLYRGKK